MTRLMRGCSVALLSLGVLGLAAGTAGAANPVKPPGGLVVHEWGTFSTFSGSDANNLRFHPNDQDLPDFMYRGPWDQTKEGRGAVLVSLETPVLYFYSDREITASVRVDFPQGMITDWYPQATRPPNRRLDWANIKVFPKGHEVTLPRDKEKEAKSRYYAAREVDASPLQSGSEEGKLEYEVPVLSRSWRRTGADARAGGGRQPLHGQKRRHRADSAFVFVQIRGQGVLREAHASIGEVGGEGEGPDRAGVGENWPPASRSC